jgi:hypothetical protein
MPMQDSELNRKFIINEQPIPFLIIASVLHLIFFAGWQFLQAQSKPNQKKKNDLIFYGFMIGLYM